MLDNHALNKQLAALQAPEKFCKKLKTDTL